MTEQFAHIADKRLVEVLEGNISEDAICYALSKTGEHLAADMVSEAVDPTVLDARLSAYEDALFAWNEEGDAAACVEALREVWG